MATSAQSSTQVSERLTQLRRAYSSISFRQTSIVVDTSRYERAIERSEGGSITEVTVRVVNDRGEVLLVAEDDGEWTAPTGSVGADEPIEAAARRVVETRTGVRCLVEDLEQVSILGFNDAEDSRRRPIYRLAALFSGTCESGSIDRSASAAEWWDEPPTDFRRPPVWNEPP